jgi:hypothetical protein
MPRPSVSKEQKEREAAFLKLKLADAQARDPSITQESLALELEMTQGNFNHWISGRSPIPDKHFLWLGNRLGFDAAVIRPSLIKYSGKPTPSDQESLILEAYRLDPEFRKTVNAVAEMSSFYKALAQPNAPTQQNQKTESVEDSKSR